MSVDDPNVHGFTDTDTPVPPQVVVGVPALRQHLPASVDLGNDAGAGLEGMSLDEQVTPFLRILQTNSPQVDESQMEYVPGARAGMLYDTAAQEGFDALMRPNAAAGAGVQVMICFREHGFGIWIPRDKEGGFRGMLPASDPSVLTELRKYGGSRFNLPRFKKDSGWTSRSRPCQPTIINGEEVELVETINYYVLYAPHGLPLAADNFRRAIMRFTSTSIGVATGLNTRMKNWVYRQPDNSLRPAQIWSYRWLVRTLSQSNASGSWYNYRFDLEPSTARPPFDTTAMILRTDPLFEEGRAFYELARRGGVKMDDAADKGGGEEDPPF